MDDKIDLNDVEIDLSGYGTALETLSVSSGADTITITDLSDTSTISTISIPTGISTYNYQGLTVGGAAPTWGNTTYSLNNSVNYGNVNITGNGIDLGSGTDLKVDGKSLKEFMSKMEQRLSILVPDPDKLEKFEALKKAYEHYKTMERLCFDEPDEENK